MRWGGKIANAHFLACIAVTDVLLSLTLAAILKTDSLIRTDSCQSSPPPLPPHLASYVTTSNFNDIDEGGTKLLSWLRFRYRSETNLLIPELVKIEAFLQ
jgi:hypothetical protein